MNIKRQNHELPDAQSLGDTGGTLAFHLSRAWMRFHDDYLEALKPLNLTPSRTLGLAFIVHNAGADQASLGRALGINRASTMNLVDKLEADGFVVRESGEDRRTHALRTTDHGRRTYKRAMEIEDRIETGLLRGLSATQVKQLRAQLFHISSNTR